MECNTSRCRIDPTAIIINSLKPIKMVEQIIQWIVANLPKLVEIINELIDLIRDVIKLFKPQTA